MFLTKLLGGHMKYNFRASQTQRRPLSLKPRQPQGVHREPYSPAPLRILWDPSTAHTQGQCQPSATQTGGQWRCGQAWCWGRTEPSRTPGLRATARTSSCSAMSGLFPGTIYIPARNVLYKVNVHMSKYSGTYE